jgi:hypothetical protein
MNATGAFGPWVPGLSETERIARIRGLRALVLVLLEPKHPICAELRDAERDDAAAARAPEAVDRVPALPWRRLLATNAELRALRLVRTSQ